MNIRTSLSAFLLATLACGASLSGCDNRQERASEAFSRYQAASASGDLAASRRALLELVAVDDDVATYWVELGRVNLELADFGAAYGAFVRAYELDRANPMILAALTQLALRSGNLDKAQEHARQLELVAPTDPAVRLTYGYVALRRGDFDGAREQAATILAATPYDPSARVLQSRILLQSGTPDEAMALLREQVRLQPSDAIGLRALLAIYELRERWSDAAATARALHELQPEDRELRVRLSDNELRAGHVQAALADTAAALKSASPREIDQLLGPWLATGHEQAVVPEAIRSARMAQPDRQVAFARFLLAARQPKEVALLLRGTATLPARLSNLSANALYGEALAQIGSPGAGLERLNGVLAVDPGHLDALRGRSELRSRQSEHKGAIEDAQKLVAANRGSSQARLTLFHAYVAADRNDDARRTLWDAFHDIPANRKIYDVLTVVVQKTNGPTAARRLAEEFDDQRNVELIRSFA